MSDDVKLSRYVAFLRHRHTNYEKHMNKMYDELGNQTELRKYVNELLCRIAQDKCLAEKTLGQIGHIIKIAGKKPPQQKFFNQTAKAARRKRNKARRLERKHTEKWLKAVDGWNKNIEREEEKTHKQYVQIMLAYVGMSNWHLNKKLLPKPKERNHENRNTNTNL